MMKKFLTSLFVLCLTAAFAQAQDSENLFDGKTLDDFGFFLLDNAPKDGTFRFEDGILKISGTPFGWLETKKTYRNFTLRCEIRHPNADETANSGLFLRITERNETCLPACIEVQMQKGNLGHLFGFHGHTVLGPSERSSFNEARALHKVMNTRNAQNEAASAWNQVEVTCFEDFLLVRVNGQIVNWAWGVQNVEGPIGFQSEGGEIWYRNAVITVEE